MLNTISPALKIVIFAEKIFHFFPFSFFLHLIFDEIFSLFKIGECSFKKLSLNIALGKFCLKSLCI